MQPDYSKMAQQQQAAPQEQGLTEEQKQQAQNISPEELDRIRAESGMPQGESKEAIKQRILAFLDQVGFLKTLNKQGLKEIALQIEEYAELIVKQDNEAVKNHPITKIIKKVAMDAQAQSKQQPMQQPMQPQSPMGAAPKNFAGMMKPPGGGMSGR